MNSPLFLPMFSHVVWTGFLYVLLTVLRAPTVWYTENRKGYPNSWADIETRASANLSNQFEWPLFFYAACLVIAANESLYSIVYLWLAWIFVFGRVLHSAIQIFSSNIRLRGLVFTINFLAVFGMWIILLLNYIKG